MSASDGLSASHNLLVRPSDNVRLVEVLCLVTTPKDVCLSCGKVYHGDDCERITEGFYDTAPNEAVEFESRVIVPMPTPVAKRAKVCRRPSVKTMLGGTDHEF